MCTWVAVQGGCGMYGGSSKGKSPSQFVFLSSLAKLPREVQDWAGWLGIWVMRKAPGWRAWADFLGLNTEGEPGCGVLSCPWYFYSEPGNPARAQPCNLGLQKFQSSVSIGLSALAADVNLFLLGFLSGFPQGSVPNYVSSATVYPTPVNTSLLIKTTPRL